ncbi:hypothetical protein JR316_0007406 [Psilocybe cubensis]|uniref:Uncharacterized protein n=1 Tax=Psilocybe cubensis TaxID=181762 RepID=A0ACB8H005_PSICU|nr:hypothetical protein JR316_0007406 [Psilocybe cubensis]KAH9480806.1 hypothetical protein JR316_0007406 [Psilocybe cubensis]
MSDSPPPIVYAAPQDSPPPIQYAPIGETDSPIITPRRKKRVVKNQVVQAKRQKKHTHNNDTTFLNALASPDSMDQVRDSIPASPTSINVFDLHKPLEMGDQEHIPDEDSDYATFLNAVSAEECGMFQLTDCLFVVNGWNAKKCQPTKMWYHALCMEINGIKNAVCLCPGTYGRATECFHSRFLIGKSASSESQTLLSDRQFNDNENLTFLFSRGESIIDGHFYNIFSTPSGTRYPTIKNRAIVEHLGEDSGTGTWKCNRDLGAVLCTHIALARHALQQYLQGDCEARDESINSSNGTVEFGDTPVRQLAGIISSVSYISLPPPIWARIASDRNAPPRITMDVPPSLFLLAENDSCSCSNPREKFNPFESTFTRTCTVYTLTSAFTASIMLQKCRQCKHRFIGPECSNLGVFNFNNTSLFTHELLDDYTSAFSSSETPFVSWVQTVSRRYQTRGSKIPFSNEKLFRSAWFSYIRLVEFSNDMMCPECGPSPDATIWDGVSVAFSRRNLLPSLHPPTTLGEFSVTRSNVRPISNLQPIPSRHTRLLIRFVLIGPSLSLLSGETIPEGTPEYERNKKLVERMVKIPDLVSQLTEINVGLGGLFNVHHGLKVVLSKQNMTEAYSKFFIQLSSDENILQLVAYNVLDNLRRFIHNPVQHNLSLLRHIPSLHRMAKHELHLGRLSNDLLEICKWLYIRSSTAYSLLKVHDHPNKPTMPSTVKEDWILTGCCYSMPQIRERPSYPNLPYEMGNDLGSVDVIEDDVCRKYYSTYSKKRLTGGIIICYGFHCIRAAEGRNDVFSAIYTRWNQAPKIIVYDFACALQPYCMSREPEFFKDTLFTIDIFHSTEHKCGEACFLSSYCVENPEFLALNSSAAECGNSGISKIRKAVSYMTQERAVMYMRVYFSIWNRTQIQKLELKLHDR